MADQDESETTERQPIASSQPRNQMSSQLSKPINRQSKAAEGPAESDQRAGERED